MGLRERAIRYKEDAQIFDSPLDTIPGPASFSVSPQQKINEEPESFNEAAADSEDIFNDNEPIDSLDNLPENIEPVEFDEIVEEEIFFPKENDQKKINSFDSVAFGKSTSSEATDHINEASGRQSFNFIKPDKKTDLWSKQNDHISKENHFQRNIHDHTVKLAGSVSNLQPWEILDQLFSVDNRGSLLDLIFLSFVGLYPAESSGLWQWDQEKLILLACQNKNQNFSDVIDLTHEQSLYLSCAYTFISLKDLPGSIPALEKMSQNWFFLIRSETEPLLLITSSARLEADWDMLQQQSRILGAAIDYFHRRKTDFTRDYVYLASQEINKIMAQRSPVIAAALSLKNLQRVQNIYGIEKENEIIEAVWEILRGELNEKDLLLRLVSNRFLLLLTQQELSGADKILNAIYDRIRQISISDEMKLIVTYQMWQSPADFNSAGELIAMFA